MTKNKDQMMDQELTSLFAGMPDAAPSDALISRILADAETTQNAHIETNTAQVPSRDGFWTKLLSEIGGWRGMATLTACTCAAVVVGYGGAETLTAYGTVLGLGEDGSLFEYGTYYEFGNGLLEG